MRSQATTIHAVNTRIFTNIKNISANKSTSQDTTFQDEISYNASALIDKKLNPKFQKFRLEKNS